MSSRMNVTLELNAHVARLLQEIATQESKKIDEIVRDFVLQALEEREDMALSKLAIEREDDAESFVSHDDAWK